MRKINLTLYTHCQKSSGVHFLNLPIICLRVFDLNILIINHVINDVNKSEVHVVDITFIQNIYVRKIVNFLVIPIENHVCSHVVSEVSIIVILNAVTVVNNINNQVGIITSLSLVMNFSIVANKNQSHVIRNLN